VRNPRIEAWRCARGHRFIHRHARCPRCGADVGLSPVPATGRLVLVTTVRVSTRDKPYRIGIVRTAGVHTLCAVEGAVRHTGYAAVSIERRGERIVVRSRRTRTRTPRASRPGTRTRRRRVPGTNFLTRRTPARRRRERPVPITP